MIIKQTNSLTSQIYQDSLAIRHEVFVKEQGVSLELEIEGEEGKTYYVGYVAEKPVVTARSYLEDATTWHLQRVATLEAFRHQGLAAELLLEIEKQAKKAQITQLTLGAQDSAQGFYQKLGYHVIGAGFLDAGIPHHRMDKFLN